MSRISLLLIGCALAALGTACSSDRERAGQVASAGPAGAPVDIYVVPPDRLAAIAARLERTCEAEDRRLKRRFDGLQCDRKALQELLKRLEAPRPAGAAPPADAVRAFADAARTRLAKVNDEQTEIARIGSSGDEALAALLVPELPPRAAQADAAGNFTVRAQPGDWLLATGLLTSGSHPGRAVWAVQVDADSGPIRLADDSRLRPPLGLRNFLIKISGISPEPQAQEPATISDDLAAWIATAPPSAP